eukprot:1076989-Pyramimonas_sp.AAC.1
MADLELQFGEAPDFHDLLVGASSADLGWEKWVTLVYETAERHFAKGITRDPLVVEYQRARSQLLRERRDARERGCGDLASG